MTEVLDDLNIVSISSTRTPPKLVIKKRKTNKYERRRQRAKKARDEKQGINKSRENESKQNMPAVAMTPNTLSDPANETSGRQYNQLEGEKHTGQGTKSPIATDPNVNSKSKNQSTKGENDESIKQNYLPKRNSHEDVHSVAILSMTNNVNEGSRKDTPKISDFGRTQMDNEQERAKYMAEFHARPMELDRRSGAKSTTLMSTESTHLFTDNIQSNCWESLNIYPRLIKTLRSSSFGNLQKPTTIQSNSIRAFYESTHAMLRDDAESKSNNKKKKNLLIHSETGSGKTLAYLLPILQSLSFGDKVDVDFSTEKPEKRSRSEMGCRCIIICPTRELASQTLQVLEPLCQANFPGWIVPGGLLGGDSRKSEKASLRKGLAIIVATPGRLLDHLYKTQSLALSLKGKLKWIVLDEADRLLDMGLGDQVRQIVQWIWANEACSTHEQPWWRSVLISATITSSVQSLAKERILCGDEDWIWVKGESKHNKAERLVPKPGHDSCRTAIKNADDFAHSTPRQLAQFHVTVTAKLRLSTLVAFLVQRVAKGERTVVFMGTCASVDFHYQLFNALEDSLWDDDNSEKYQDDTSTVLGLFGRKARVFKLHGSVSHLKRSQTMKELNSKTTSDARKMKPGADILLTTDVSARGLNLKDFDWTVQYDPPCEISDYVHRVGRVARAGRAGHSVLFLLPSERKYIEVLQTKGIRSLTPLSLSDILNQAASICKEVTKEGSRQTGEGTLSTKYNKHTGHLHNGRLGEHFSAEVQRRLENFVVINDAETRKAFRESTSQRKQKQRKRKLVKSSKDGRKEGLLLEMAREAFLSFLRAYSTKREPIVRSIFSSRALHFGHIAKSFALKEPPKSLVSKQKSKREQQEEESKDEQANLPRSLEFGRRSLDARKLSNDEDTSDGEYMECQSQKQKKTKLNEKLISAKSLLLENAAKMQRNLMDAM
mmetsp:Transcript_4570/g.11774  ORF Transcript_4570/g.11774 Transcript_4570/m.11774 type:complete len:944 (+) Transcript_4570:110-2941(+)